MQLNIWFTLPHGTDVLADHVSKNVRAAYGQRDVLSICLFPFFRLCFFIMLALVPLVPHSLQDRHG